MMVRNRDSSLIVLDVPVCRVSPSMNRHDDITTTSINRHAISEQVSLLITSCNLAMRRGLFV